jgi:hypothetical protein
VLNKGGDLLAAGLAEVLGAAELGSVLLNQRGIQTMLADQKAELVTEFGFAIAVGGLGRKPPYIRLGLAASGQGSDLFDRADSDPVSLAERPVHSPGLGHAHLGTPDKGRDVGRVGISEPNKPLAAAGLVDGSFECPSGTLRVAELANGLNSDAVAMSPIGEPQKA